MIINKDYDRKVQKEYFYIQGNLEIDCDYFIEQIEKGFNSKNNMNYKTNIKGSMTSFDYFQKNLKFNNIVRELSEYLDNSYLLKKYYLHDAWGFKTEPGEKTLLHDHLCYWSGVIYLNKCDQPLNFPEINQHLNPEKGAFAIFSPWLLHGCERNQDKVPKYGISFNMKELKNWEELHRPRS